MAIIFSFYFIKDTISLVFFKTNFEINYFFNLIEQTYALQIQKVNLL